MNPVLRHKLHMTLGVSRKVESKLALKVHQLELSSY